jgi:transcriptional regulator with XRE-family HTH domain
MAFPLLEDGAPGCRWMRVDTWRLHPAERVSIFAQSVTFPSSHGMIPAMSGMAGDGVAGHFARQVKKERLAHGWSLAELGRRTGLDPAHLGRVESSRRPPTEAIAAALDTVFPERRGWFTDWLSESREWAEIPATFRSWPDYEDRAATIRTWNPGIIGGLVQCEEYARALIAVQPGVTDEIMAARLATRAERQRRVLERQDSPPSVWIIVDEMALYREVGTPAVMAAQMRHLAEVAARPQVTLTVMRAIAHAANASGFVLADDAAWCEHLAAGGVYTEPQTVSMLAQRFDSLRAECYRASESLAMIDRTTEIWASGVSPLTRMATAASA